MKREIALPKIGFRIIKSAIAVALCFAINYLRAGEGIVFYSQLSALWCIQTYKESTMNNAVQRFSGTVIGALYGLITLLCVRHIDVESPFYSLFSASIISVSIVLVLYTTVLLDKKKASYFSCVVFLSIVVNHIGDVNPYMFVFNRFLDTAIGIVIGIAVNDFTLPGKRKRDVLFVSTMDQTLTNSQEHMSDYTVAMLNRMIDDGMQFTLATMRTPAVICETFRNVRLKLPVIAMDGAVLYDINGKKYLKSYVISYSKAKQLRDIFEEENCVCFTNIVIDDTLLIYYEGMISEVQKRMIDDLRRSPYRNFICQSAPDNHDVVYFMLLDETERMQRLYDRLMSLEICKDLKIVFYASDVYEGCSYIKIFNHNASMENMIEYLQQMTGLKSKITFGTIKGKYDCFISGSNLNEVAHEIYNRYLPNIHIFVDTKR